MTTVPDVWDLAAQFWSPEPDPNADDKAACRASSATFAERHCKIEDPEGNVLDWDLWPCQVETFKTLEDEHKVIILKGRRLGMSWVVLAFALWLALFHQGIRILILCKKEDDAKKLLDRIKRMHRRIAENPDSAHLLAGLAIGEDAKTTFQIGESHIMALVGTEDSARSETAGLVILDEFAFQSQAPGIWKACIPATNGGGRLVALSTGNGSEKSTRKGAEFALQWRRAKLGLSGFKALFHNWATAPGRDQAWYDAEQAALGEDPYLMRTEHPTTEDDAFLLVGAKLIYPGSHIDAVEALGAATNATDSRRPTTALLGMDWGVHTHASFADETAGGGLRVLAEYYSDRADIEVDAIRCGAVLRELGCVSCRIRYDPGSAGAKVIGTFIRLLKVQCPRITFEVKAIPFAKFKFVAIQYAQLLAKRAGEGQALRALAVDGKDAPELLRQMRGAEWKVIPGTEEVDDKTKKGDDHGHDSLLTLTAELGYRMFHATKTHDDAYDKF